MDVWIIENADWYHRQIVGVEFTRERAMDVAKEMHTRNGQLYSVSIRRWIVGESYADHVSRGNDTFDLIKTHGMIVSKEDDE